MSAFGLKDRVNVRAGVALSCGFTDRLHLDRKESLRLVAARAAAKTLSSSYRRLGSKFVPTRPSRPRIFAYTGLTILETGRAFLETGLAFPKIAACGDLRNVGADDSDVAKFKIGHRGQFVIRTVHAPKLAEPRA
jgi:hypothetical protein